MSWPLAACEERSVQDSNSSIFVLPFRYRLVACGGTAPPTAFTKDDDSIGAQLGQRRDYMTAETGGLVYPHRNDSPVSGLFDAIRCETEWYDLRFGGKTLEFGIRWYRPGHNGELVMPCRCRIVLFGDPRSTTRPAAAACSAIGFLLVESGIDEGATLDDLLDFNANFRLIHYLFPGHAERLAQRRTAKAPTTTETETVCARLNHYDVLLPAGLDDKITPRHDDEVGLWQWLLGHSVNIQGQAWRIEWDASVHPDARLFLVTHVCIAGVPWETEEDSRLWTLWHQLLHVEERSFTERGYLVPYEKEWARVRTYPRWGQSREDRRLYGYSNYSAASLVTEGAFAPPLDHFRGIYFDQLLMLLYQRAAAFSYSRELAALTQRWKSDGWAAVRSDFDVFREEFAQFLNLYRYPLFTNQVQGIEMYKIARGELDNRALFDELRTEMDTTWGYMEGFQDREEERSSLKFNRAAFWFATFGLLVGLAGVSCLQLQDDQLGLVLPTREVTWFLLGVFAVFMMPILVVILRCKRRRRTSDPN